MNIRDIYKLNLMQRKEQFGSTDVKRLIIDGIEFTGYKTYTFYFEKTYSEEPERSLAGTINNLNAVPFFITPRLRVNFSMMSISDYRKLYTLILSKNEFTVTCYNVITNQPITCKMYFEPDDFPTLYMVARQIQGDTSIEKWNEITGIRDYTVTMNGTNASLDLVSIIYKSNPQPDAGAQEITQAEPDIALNTEILIGSASNIQLLTFNEKYMFNGWNTRADGKGLAFVDGQAYTIGEHLFLNDNLKSLTLYAQWKPMDTYTINYSYGLSAPEIKNGQPRYNEQVQNGTVITLPTIQASPNVTYDDRDYSPYENGGWYKTSTKNESMKVLSPYTYNLTTSSTLYCLYDTKKYFLTFNTNDSNISLDPIKVAYGESIIRPELYAQGKTFLGWYWGANDNNELEGQPFKLLTMPPYNVTIYAKWQ